MRRSPELTFRISLTQKVQNCGAWGWKRNLDPNTCIGADEQFCILLLIDNKEYVLKFSSQQEKEACMTLFFTTKYTTMLSPMLATFVCTD